MVEVAATVTFKWPIVLKISILGSSLPEVNIFCGSAGQTEDHRAKVTNPLAHYPVIQISLSPQYTNAMQCNVGTIDVTALQCTVTLTSLHQNTCVHMSSTEYKASNVTCLIFA